MNSSIQYYKMLLRVIFDSTPIVPQTSKSPDNVVTTSLTSNYLCLQCSTIVTEEDRAKHGSKKSHRFYVDSRSGSLYCQFCEDFVWDPTLEELRVRKIGTGSFTSKCITAAVLHLFSVLLRLQCSGSLAYTLLSGWC